MNEVRELVGALTQARVQMIAARAILEEVANDATDGSERAAIELHARKLARCLGVVDDVRGAYQEKQKDPPRTHDGDGDTGAASSDTEEG